MYPVSFNQTINHYFMRQNAKVSFGYHRNYAPKGADRYTISNDIVQADDAAVIAELADQAVQFSRSNQKFWLKGWINLTNTNGTLAPDPKNKNFIESQTRGGEPFFKDVSEEQSQAMARVISRYLEHLKESYLPLYNELLESSSPKLQFIVFKYVVPPRSTYLGPSNDTWHRDRELTKHMTSFPLNNHPLLGGAKVALKLFPKELEVEHHERFTEDDLNVVQEQEEFGRSISFYTDEAAHLANRFENPTDQEQVRISMSIEIPYTPPESENP